MELVKVPIPNITLVAFRQFKPQALMKLLEDVWALTDSALIAAGLIGSVKWNRHCEHATIMGNEIVRIGNGIFDLNWLNNKTEFRIPDVHGFCRHLKSVCQPVGRLFEIRHGGFREAYCKCLGGDKKAWACQSGAEFHSCDRTPYEASYYAYSKGPLMITGWPLSAGGGFDHRLYQLRKDAEQFGLLDKYHSDQTRLADWMDDDWFLRLGTVGDVPPDVLCGMVERIRHQLSKQVITYPVMLKDLSVVFYRDTLLNDVQIYPIEEVIAKPDLVQRLYAQIGDRGRTRAASGPVLRSNVTPQKYEEWRGKFMRIEQVRDAGALLEALPGRSKYDPDTLLPKKYEGISVIHNIDAAAAKELRLAESFELVRREIGKAGLGPKIAFVDTAGVHVTTFDLVNRPEHEDKLLQGDYSYQTACDAVRLGVIKWLQETHLKLRAKALITTVGMFAPAVLKFDVAFESDVLEEFQAFRMALHKHLCRHIDGYTLVRSSDWSATLASHITIGYFVKPLAAPEIERLLGTVKRLNDSFEGVEFEISEGEVTSFSDMDHYKPVQL